MDKERSQHQYPESQHKYPESQHKYPESQHKYPESQQKYPESKRNMCNYITTEEGTRKHNVFVHVRAMGTHQFPETHVHVKSRVIAYVP